MSLATEMKQQQRLTPLQVQFVRMLEMTGPEAEDEVQRALDEMPALEAVENDGERVAESSFTEDGALFTESDRDMQRADFRSEDDVPDYLDFGTDAHVTASLAGMGDRIFDNAPAMRNYPQDSGYESPVMADSAETLLEHLGKQLAELPLSPDDGRVARYIIGSIDDNGYMTRPLQSIADDLAINAGMDVGPERLHRIFESIRGLDPAGVGATDLRDCLLLQLRRLPRSAESLTALEAVDKHFDLFTKKHFDRIAYALGISRDDMQNALAVIARLNPKPGSALASSPLEERSRHITPDFSVEADENGKLTMTLLSRIPELRVEASFVGDTSVPPGDDKRLEDARLFIRRKRDDARNFIKIVNLRQETLFRVMSAIVKLQHKFFLTEEDEDIRPMVLRDIAALTGYNLSVISRATQGKYVATLRGLYPLKKFFNEKLRDDDDNVTSNRIIAEIRSAISAENPRDPLSDREITGLLAGKGFDIARRTVAKYRESLGIPVARLRKQR